jgi:hypothetical protein
LELYGVDFFFGWVECLTWTFFEFNDGSKENAMRNSHFHNHFPSSYHVGIAAVRVLLTVLIPLAFKVRSLGSIPGIDRLENSMLTSKQKMNYKLL